MYDATDELPATVAAMYYIDQMTQNAIATELGLSRVKVHRLLKQARDDSVVEIFVNWPLRRNATLEAGLVSTFDLEAAIVLQSSAQARVSTLAQLGQLGARHLESRLRAGATLAVCLGRSTFEVIQAIRPNLRVQVDVAQALGSMPATLGELDSAALARRLADKLGGRMLALSSPFMAESVADAQVLRAQRDIDRTLTAVRGADLALLGIGAVDPARSNLVRSGFLTASELSVLAENDVVGDMAGQLFHRDGADGPSAVNQRIIGVTIEDLRAIPHVIAVAIGREKRTAILGALRTRAIDAFGTDEETAQALLQERKS